ncbi:hypothetical protein V1477_005809 [Vespula maculifrons]|uniref:Uncharacterized protein n=1 Tax=Vespula maculifrons TaxID=7453 RepID=A0ABD2CLM0_VESMC
MHATRFNGFKTKEFKLDKDRRTLLKRLFMWPVLGSPRSSRRTYNQRPSRRTGTKVTVKNLCTSEIQRDPSANEQATSYVGETFNSFALTKMRLGEK